MNVKVIFVFTLIALLASHDAFAFLPLTPATIIIQQTSGGTGFGTYNQTLANNVIKNSGGKGLNFINSTNNPIRIINDPTRNQINITIADTTGSSGVTSLNALTGALTIACVSGNTTCTSSGGNTITVNTAYNIVTTGLSAQTITKQLTINTLILGGDENVGSNALTNAGHKSTLPSTSGVLCQTNQSSTCGSAFASITSINSQTGPAVNIVRGSPGNITITNSTNLISINTGQNIANLATTNNQTFLHKVNFTVTSSQAGLNVGTLSGVPSNGKPGDITQNTGNNKFVGMWGSTSRNFVSETGAATLTNKILDASNVLSDTSDTTKRFGWLLSGMTAGKTLTFRGNQTTSQGVNWPNIRETETIAMQPQTTSTTNSTTQTTTSTTLLMGGNTASITPQITGKIRIALSGTVSSNTISDGCKIQIQYGTGTIPTAGQAVTGTTAGLLQTIDSGTANENLANSMITTATGLTVGTTYWIQAAYAADTGGTCSIKNQVLLVQEY